MLTKDYMTGLATKNQTSYLNVLREYIQNIFLKSFYSQNGSKNFLFKGGTALKIVFNSPRYSEDLDFSGYGNSQMYEKVLEGVLYDINSSGIGIGLEDSKSTSGGHIANLSISAYGAKVMIKNQISFRDKNKKSFENAIVVNDFLPTYNIYILDRRIMVSEKINALIERAKPRDFFDLYFILRNENLRKHMKITSSQRVKILENIEKQNKKFLKNELKTLLPMSFWKVIDDLPSALKKDL